MSGSDGGLRLAMSMTSAIEGLWYAPAEAPVPWWAHALALPELAFKAVVAARGQLFDRNWAHVTRIDGARVISVGNLTAGGSGKTPAVIHLAGLCAKAGRKVFVLSRGYGRESHQTVSFSGADSSLPGWEEVGDEPLLIARRCPSATVMVGADRASLAAQARRRGADVILLDDGMQHRRLARDIDILVVDSASGFGNLRLLPRGPLREPLSAVRRATVIWLVGSDAVHGPALPSFDQRTVRVTAQPSQVVLPSGETLAAHALSGRRVVALAGIARPERFARTLQALGANLVATRFVPDHRPFPPAMLEPMPDALLITTEKDAVRLPEGAGVAQLRLETTVSEGQATLAETLGIADA